MFRHSTRPRHAVIDQDGRTLDDTRPLRGLRAALQLAVRRPESEAPAVWRPNTGPDDLSGIGRMPFTVHADLAMRVPTAPVRVLPASRVGHFVDLGFRMVARELDQLVRVLSSGWQKLAVENDQRMADLDVRLARMTARQHEWAAAEDGRLLGEAYARGGTELVERLTPQVLARMDARAKAGAGVAA